MFSIFCFNLGFVEFDAGGRVLSIEEKPAHLKVTTPFPVCNSMNYPLSMAIKPSARGELEITPVNEHFREAGNLTVTLLEPGTAWLDTETFRRLQDAGEFVRVIEDRTGTKVECLKEIAWRQGWTNYGDLRVHAELRSKRGYGAYSGRLVSTGSKERRNCILDPFCSQRLFEWCSY